MSPGKEIRNVPASVRQRLRNLAIRQDVRFNAMLERFTAERFLYRLSASGEVDRFVLKGAALFRVWDGKETRPTRDLDFLAESFADRAAMRSTLEAICRIPCPEDGVVFDPATIRIREIRIATPDGGLRVRLQGKLGGIRLPLNVDIGFGDAITPEAEVQDYPTLLDLPAPRLRTYPRETMIAEKFMAMVRLGARNTREKDLWDIASLARRFVFDGETLRTAIGQTFRRREHAFPRETPLALLPQYYEDAARAQRWRELHRQAAADSDNPARLVDAGDELRRFLGPVCDSLIKGTSFTETWPAGGPWRSGVQARTGGEGGG